MPLIECLLGAVSQHVNGTTYSFSRDKHSRFVADVASHVDAGIFTSVEHYREVSAEPPEAKAPRARAPKLDPAEKEAADKAAAEKEAADKAAAETPPARAPRTPRAPRAPRE